MSDMDTHCTISRYLNKPKTIGGFTYDEVIISGGIFMFCFFALGAPLLGIVTTAIFAMTLKRMKRSKGTSFLLVRIYWLMPPPVQRMIYNKTPTSDNRFWLY